MTIWGPDGKKNERHNFSKHNGSKSTSLFTVYNLLFKNRAELLWFWPENKNTRGRRPELRSLAWWCAGVHDGLTWLEKFKTQHSWLAALIGWPALMLRATPGRWDVAVKCVSVPRVPLCARPSALTYELLLRFNDVCVKFVGEDKMP